MKLYLDTASVKEIQETMSVAAVDGITTNPSWAAKEGHSFREVLREISRLVDGPISAEVVTTDAEAMIKEGRELAKIHQNIVVKVPLIPDGLRATRKLTAEGIRVNVTCAFHLHRLCWQQKREPGVSLLLLAGWMISARVART